jgi:uncharacterized membrane protein
MADWLEHSAQVELPVSVDTVWQLWSDLEQMPNWMKWIESVKILDNQPELSRWKLASGTFEFTWLSRILKEVPNQIIQWESVDGLPNKGAIRFYDRKEEGSIVRLTVGYKVPMVLRWMDGLFLGQVVESTLQADMNRFRDYALEHAPEVSEI